MSKLDLVSKVPAQYEKQVIADIIRTICAQVNSESEGRLAGRYAARASVPTGTAAAFAVGDIVWDSNPTVVGSVVAGVAADYVRIGWVNTVAGTPGTFKELRVPVGSGDGVPAFPAFAPITKSLSGDVSLNNAANFFDGPSIAQGTTGTWYASGTVVVTDTVSAADVFVKLWDGTTVIASASVHVGGANQQRSVSLSGFLSSPAANIRMSVRDATNTTGKILFNHSGNSKDSTITALRIA